MSSWAIILYKIFSTTIIPFIVGLFKNMEIVTFLKMLERQLTAKKVIAFLKRMEYEFYLDVVRLINRAENLWITAQGQYDLYYAEFYSFYIEYLPPFTRAVMSLWYDKNVIPHFLSAELQVPESYTYRATHWEMLKFINFAQHHPKAMLTLIECNLDPVGVIAGTVYMTLLGVPGLEAAMISTINLQSGLVEGVPPVSVIQQTIPITVSEFNDYFARFYSRFFIKFSWSNSLCAKVFDLGLNSFYPKKVYGLPTYMYDLTLDPRTPPSVLKWATYHFMNAPGSIDEVYKYLYTYWRKDNGINVIKLYGAPGTSKYWFSLHDLVIGKPKIMP